MKFGRTGGFKTPCYPSLSYMSFAFTFHIYLQWGQRQLNHQEIFRDYEHSWWTFVSSSSSQCEVLMLDARTKE